ncbi:MAG TPA: hypothetical protein VKS78_03925 [Roseiarcus sp.]|nr:hypothetical protein [Roseiarcus sp.]
MIRRAKGLIPGALALLAAGLVLAVIAPAHAAQPMRHRHHVARYVAPRGDIVVHTGRSYLDPGPSADLWTEDKYYADTVWAPDPALVYPFGRFGLSVLPSRFDPPGQEPLFTFW